MYTNLVKISHSALLTCVHLVSLEGGTSEGKGKGKSCGRTVDLLFSPSLSIGQR